MEVRDFWLELCVYTGIVTGVVPVSSRFLGEVSATTAPGALRMGVGIRYHTRSDCARG